jgi:hypothetical protein
MQNKKLIVAGLLLAVMTGCAQHYPPEAIADLYGLFSGIWHGAISPATLLINLLSWLLSLFEISFLADIQIIGRPNTGFWYYLGFFIGLCSTCGVSPR